VGDQGEINAVNAMAAGFFRCADIAARMDHIWSKLHRARIPPVVSLRDYWIYFTHIDLIERKHLRIFLKQSRIDEAAGRFRKNQSWMTKLKKSLRLVPGPLLQ